MKCPLCAENQESSLIPLNSHGDLVFVSGVRQTIRCYFHGLVSFSDMSERLNEL